MNESIHVGTVCFRRCEKGSDGKMRTIPTEMGVAKDKNGNEIGFSFRIQSCLNFFVVNPDMIHAGIRCFCYADITKKDWIGMRVISIHPHGKSATCEPIFGNPETELFPHFEHTFAVEESVRALQFLTESCPDKVEEVLTNATAETAEKWLRGDQRFKNAGLDLVERAAVRNIGLGQDIIFRVIRSIGPLMKPGSFHYMIKDLQAQVKEAREKMRSEIEPSNEDINKLESWANHEG